MNGLLPSFETHLPRRVVYGRGTALKLAEVLRTQGWSRVFVTSDQGVRGAGLLEIVTEPLRSAGMLAGVVADVPAEPPIDAVDRLMEVIRGSNADVIVGLGGGSVMDATKVAAVGVRHGRSARSYLGIGQAGGRGLPTVLVPTTAGTGSETTYNAILTDTAAGVKIGVVDPALMPDLAILDPSLTDGLPTAITAATGMDALIHALEGFISKKATPLVRGLALQAGQQIAEALPIVCVDPGNRSARDAMVIGSHLAGMAFANSSCCAVHALAYPLGGRFHIPHGVIIGCFAGAMMRHNGSVCTTDFKSFAEASGWTAPTPTAFAAQLDALAAGIGLFGQLRHVDVPTAVIPEMAREAVAIRRLIDPNPRDVTAADAERIYREVLIA